MRSWLAALLVFSGCATRNLTTDADMSVGSVCGAPNNVMVANGVMSTPIAIGKLDFLNCCEAAEINIQSDGFSDHMVFSWRAQGGVIAPPVALDLANLPTGWGVSLEMGPGCDSLTTCMPTKRYQNLVGELTLARTSSGYSMSLCLDLPDLQLWVAGVNAS
jgi:hypothetical protein